MPETLSVGVTRHPRPVWLRLGTFALVGGLSTATYAVAALVLEWGFGVPAIAASLIGYMLGMPISYCGHRRLTFASDAPHRQALPRFVTLSICGTLIALAAPWLIVNRFGWPSPIAVLATCVAVPLVNFLLLDRLIFRGPSEG